MKTREFSGEFYSSIYRLSEQLDEKTRAYISSFFGKISMFGPYVAHEFYRALGGNPEKIPQIVDFSVAGTMAWDLYDWIVDQDLEPEEIPHAVILSKSLDNIAVEIAEGFGSNALKMYKANCERYKHGAEIEKTQKPTRKTSVTVLEYKSHIAGAILVPVAIAAETSESLDRILEVSKQLYRTRELYEQIYRGPKDPHDLGHFFIEEELRKMKGVSMQHCSDFFESIGAYEFLIDVGEYVRNEGRKLKRKTKNAITSRGLSFQHLSCFSKP
jgi:hypothetical protein